MKTGIIFLGALTCICVQAGGDGASFSSLKVNQQPPAEKRFWGKGKDKKGGEGGGHGGGPPTGGFGMYPLWKFHKFDGFSLRPVPIQLDIGQGIPQPPPSMMPSYGGWGSARQPQASYSAPPADSYGSQPSSGGSYAPAGGYGGYQQSQTMSYQPAQQGYQAPAADYQPPQQSGGGYAQSAPQAPAAPAYQPATITLGYQAEPQPSYGEAGQQAGYAQQSAPYQAPMEMSYGASSAPQQYGGQQQQQGYQQTQAPAQQYSGSADMGYGASSAQPTVASGSGYGAPAVPSYAAYDGQYRGGVQDMSMPMESGSQGYVKRYYNIESDSSKTQQSSTVPAEGQETSKQQ